MGYAEQMRGVQSTVVCFRGSIPIEIATSSAEGVSPMTLNPPLLSLCRNCTFSGSLPDVSGKLAASLPVVLSFTAILVSCQELV